MAAIDEAALDPLSRRRRRYLQAHLEAARARIDYIRGVRLPFGDEARAFFGVELELRPLSSYEAVLAKIEELVPGDGPLGERVTAFRDRYAVPTERIDEVVSAAIAECRRRTLRHIELPAGEAFTAELVTGKPWQGYNWYKGDAHSVIQVNTDGPFPISRAVPLGCHEGYPGHHTHNVLMEERLVEGRGLVELSVLPLYSPLAIIAEGSSNYGIDLAFPGEERLAFEAEVLYPLAGLDPATAPALRELDRAFEDLSGLEVTIAADYIDGRIDRERALALLQSHALASPPRAAQRITFIEAYRSYAVNYWIGEELVRAHVEGAAADPDGRWRALEAILAQPTVPADLQ
ncbi:MAG TPA: hypothetical protein VKZ63_03175 [Kofleriaceae bacterium]|nr:hypothetical protein [Kofleriaceae bacterium]